MNQNRKKNVEALIAVLRASGEKGATVAEITTKSKLTVDKIETAYLDAQEERIETDHKSGSKQRFWLSRYERQGLHPNAGEVMGWLEDRPVPRARFED